MAQNVRGLFRSQFRAGLNHTLEDYLSRLRTVRRTEHDADWAACAYSPPTNMMYMPLSAICAESGTTARTREQRAATISLAIAAGGLVFGMSPTAAAPLTTRQTRCCGGEPRVASQRIPVAPVVDGRQYVVERTGRRGTPRAGTRCRPNCGRAGGKNIFFFRCRNVTVFREPPTHSVDRRHIPRRWNKGGPGSVGARENDRCRRGLAPGSDGRILLASMLAI